MIHSAQKRGPLNRRAFFAMMLLASGTLLPVSGIMNHDLQFAPLTPERHFWMSVHNMAALLFSISAVWHVAANARAILHYAKNSYDAFVS